MSEIINVITQKPSWQEKINDQSIVSKWKAELSQQGISNQILDKAIELLKKSTQTTDFEGDDEYEWHLFVGVEPDFWAGCNNCECLVCSGEEHLAMELEDYEEGDEDYREVQKKLKKFAKIKCKCKNRWVQDNLQLLRKSLFYKKKMIDTQLKERFLEHVKAFETGKNEKDYHPGSNNQMLDIIHPALYCYVKGVTPVGNGGEELVEKSSLFQWIPSEFSVIRDPLSHEPVRTEIKSYINNLDLNDPRGAVLYQDIADIFTKMVPGFEKVLNQLKEDNRINAIKDKGDTIPEIKLGDCQVIVKISSAEVNRDKPLFKEGSWHLEGVDSEKIIATGIYYYDMEGIEPTYLRFRTSLAGDVHCLNYPQNCHDYVELHYGLKLRNHYGMDGANTVVKLGRIPTKKDLFLFFPNFLQHRVSPMVLKPEASQGHRSILVFFLVNPFEKVISSSHIATPQQQTISLAETKLYRELLMFERKYEYGEQNQFHQRGISLCEH